jgi:putative ABC transport system substrate-binding protein
VKRREFIAGLGSAAAAWPLAATAQQPERIIGVLGAGDENDLGLKLGHSSFTKALADLGWTDGRNVRMDLRWAGGDINRIRALGQELVGQQPDIIVTHVDQVVRLNAPLSIFDDKLSCLIVVISIKQRGMCCWPALACSDQRP